MNHRVNVLILLLLVISACQTSTSRKERALIDINAKEINGVSGAMISLEDNLPIDWVTGIPDSVLKPKLYESVTNQLQFGTNKFARGLIDSTQYNKDWDRWLDAYAPNNRPKSNEFLKSDILFIIGQDQKGNVVAGLDPSLDYDFTDGIFWNVGNPEDLNEVTLEKLPIVTLKGQFWEGSEILESTQTVRLGFNEFPNFGIFAIVSPTHNPRFSVEIENTNYLFEIDKGTFWNFKNKHLSIQQIDTVEKLSSGDFQLGDTILVNSNKLVFTDIDAFGSWIEYENLGVDSTFIYPGKGGVAPAIVAKTVDNKEFDLASLRGKYVFLDFWGTWCKPCVEAIPELILAHQQFGDKVTFVGLALNDTDDIIDFTKKKNILWPQISLNGDYESIVDSYKINGYPTYLLVDPDGRIVAKDGKLHPSNLPQYLAEILN